MAAVAKIAQKLDRQERARQLSVSFSAARGSADAVNSLIKEWSAE